jgi:hypothetical protein
MSSLSSRTPSRTPSRKPQFANRPGFALEATLIVMVLISALIFAAASGVIANQQTTTVDQGNTQALYVAEGGADAVMSQLSSFMSDGFLSDAELGSITAPTIPGWTYDPIVATRMGGDSISTITSGDFAGLVSYNQHIDLRVHAHDVNNNRGDVIITANAQAIPVFQFGVFYDGDLEIHPGANMVYLSAPGLHFMSLITTPDSVNWQRKAYNERLNGVSIDNASGTANLLAFDNRSTTWAQFTSQSQSTFDGRLRSKAQGVAPLRLPLPSGVAAHTMIEPRVGADNNQIKGVKFANKADFLLRINMAANTTAGSNMFKHNDATVNAGGICTHNGGRGSARSNPTNSAWSATATWVRDSSGFNVLPDSTACKGIFKFNPTAANAASPTLTPTSFTDGRETHKMTVLDIDVAALKVWIDASWATRKVKVLYVEFYNVPAGVYPAVRLINGSHLPGVEPIPVGAQGGDYGLTIATEYPIYIKGDFNYSGGNATTIANDWKPASVVGDAIIFLSPSWNDNTNGGAYGVNPMVENAAGGFLAGTGYTSTTQYVYAAIAAGHSPSPCDWQGPGCPGLTTSYGGGLENFPRFLEDWGGQTLLYRGSLVSLFDAQKNLGAWNGSPYSPPARDWRFDLRFQTPSNLPPGTPLVGTVMQLAFRPVY